MARYVYDQEWRQERERLRGIERVWDPGSRAVLERLGVGEGWRCLDVGAGGGSMTEWLSHRVGDSGSVLAADVSIRFLEAIDRPNVEVRELDVLTDDLPEGEFDLVYSRCVAEHIGVESLARMVAGLRSGGLLVVEDTDWGAADVHPPDPRFDSVRDAVLSFMSSAGFDPRFGRRLPLELRALGLEHVGAEGRVILIRGGTADTAFYRLSLGSLAPALLEAGDLSEDDMATVLTMLDEPDRTVLSPIVVAAWGRRP